MRADARLDPLPDGLAVLLGDAGSLLGRAVPHADDVLQLSHADVLWVVIVGRKVPRRVYN